MERQQQQTDPMGQAWLGMGALGLAWGWLFRGAWAELAQSLAQASRFHWILLGVGLLGLGLQIGFRRAQIQIAERPLWRGWPLGVTMAACGVAVLANWLLNWPLLAIVLMGISGYGLVGLVMQPWAWRQGWLVMGLLLGLLPISLQFGSGWGFPARILTARVVEQILQVWQIQAISSADVIVLENGIAHVDLPCSGLKGLGVGVMFLLLATWLEGRRLGWRWLAVVGAGGGLLMGMNTLRVLALVSLGMVADQPQLASLLHVPLGILGFGLACGLSWLGLQQVPKLTAPDPVECDRDLPLSRINLVGLLGIVLGLSLLPQPPLLTASLPTLLPPAGIVMESLALSPTERDFFAQDPQTQVQKQRFKLAGLSGSVLRVASGSWRVQHAPELCFAGNGFQVDSMVSVVLPPDIQARWLSLQAGSLSAVYWFQSPQQTTDDLLSRLWSEVARQERRWVMTSILFDAPHQATDPDIEQVVMKIYRANQRMW